MLHEILYKELTPFIKPDKKAFKPQFFQAFKGGYGYGDQFMGVMNPDVHAVAKKYRTTPYKEVFQALQDSPWHEVRHTCLSILVLQYPKLSIEDQDEVATLYLTHADYINNWDLVDSSVYKILGPNYVRRNLSLLPLAKDNHFWKKRMGIVGLIAFIRDGQLGTVFETAEYIISHQEEYRIYLATTHNLNDKESKFWNSLVHKGMGWMLREAGIRNQTQLIEFLSNHWQNLTSVMRSYATEKLTKKQKAAIKIAAL